MLKKRILTSVLSVIMGLGLVAPTIAPIQAFATDLIKTSNFDDGKGLPWTEVETPPTHADCDISGGFYNLTATNIATGSERWDLQFRHRGLTIINGHTYNLKFTIEASKDCQIYVKLGEMGGKYAEFWNYGTTADDTLGWKMMPLKGGVPTTIDTSFKVDFSKQTQDPDLVSAGQCTTSELAFHLGGINGEGQYTGGISSRSDLPIKYSFSDIHLIDPQAPTPIPDPIKPSNAIRVNQVGYYPNLEKTATLVTKSTTAVPWALHNSAGTVVATGTSKLYKDSATGTSLDKASGDKVQIIDFSSYKTLGKGYYLTVDNQYIDPTLVADSTLPGATLAKSMPFNIGTDIYTKLKNDSINYFYQNRSGIDITMPYCVRDDLARVEGIKDTALKNVPSSGYSGDSDTYDVEKGWFDAGDHGKYVVNGGISVWTLMNEYERALNSSDTSLVKKAPFADGTMNIPENADGKPDILNETRWEIEFMLGMQIPDGTYAGMVHHSAHDVSWTALCTRPDQDDKTRYVYPPSTQATLNLAASAAQASRLWASYDSDFAAKCLTAAKAAYVAAKANPKMYFKTGGTGGGDYGDTNATDEFYWAACELYATTKDSTYLTDAKSYTDKYLQMPSGLQGGEDIGVSGAFDWGNVAGLGTLTLLTAKTGLSTTDIATAKANVAKAADVFINTENTQGYGSPITEAPLTVSTTGEQIVGYPWGSNSFVSNEAIVMAYAYDYTNNAKYANGVATALDYLLGRNPNVQSYVTGYGSNPLLNPHHRFWSHEEDSTYPSAPAGCISGGPNSGLEDPWVFGMGWKPGGYPGEKCFTDNIESWSTNEITINWNAPLSWLTTYMDYAKVNPVNVIGDVNNDGRINVLDYLLLGKAVNGKVTLTGDKLKNADTNADGTITSADLTALRYYLTRKVKALPYK
ncbi:MAG: glycoside hydrolase family 9 protein [Bacillota bacterium]|nr:glycoside hydrolase family 9 protein [Bacillota bacterium]